MKLSDTHSSWTTINRGVPQGSVLGLLLFNIFMNDLFYVTMDSDLYNYADDNTISKTGMSYTEILNTVATDTCSSVDWFTINDLSANKEKFQCMSLGKETNNINYIRLYDTEIKCVNNINILGVNLDQKLNFGNHISNLCKKGAIQLNVLRRLS